jgi:topoisomerase-4 subunit B
MYIGGQDEAALHHLVTELIDNAIDEAIAGYADVIEISLSDEGACTVSDNGRGIPIDEHPQYLGKTALEVIMTTLHSGGKFSGDSYITSGGLHGVGLSVVNALSSWVEVTVLRDGKSLFQRYEESRPLPPEVTPLQGRQRSGTYITFLQDPEIFKPPVKMVPAIIYKMARVKAYLFKNVKIHWSCSPKYLGDNSNIPQSEVLYFPDGLSDFLKNQVQESDLIGEKIFFGRCDFSEKFGAETLGYFEWAIAWPGEDDDSAKVISHCNTIPTPQGGTHEIGFRAALVRSLKKYCEFLGDKRGQQIISDDVFSNTFVVLSVFISNPLFVGQTKEKLFSPDVQRMIEVCFRDYCDNWLANNSKTSEKILEAIIADTEERIRRKEAKGKARKSPTKKLRLPGKLTDCITETQEGTEIFIVEGDSAGGSAKQARNRHNQAILPLRGKILNVATTTEDKFFQNQELQNLLLALGVEPGDGYVESDLRYEKVIIMTDADVDGAHITALLLTFFFVQLPKLTLNGHLYMAAPPLYRLVQQNAVAYAADDSEKDKLLQSGLGGSGQIEVGRFKGLGEMMYKQLRETTMDPKTRRLIQISSSDCSENFEETKNFILNLMGRNSAFRLQFIQESASNFSIDSVSI